MTKSSSRIKMLTLLASLPRETFTQAGLDLERQLEPYFDETVGLFKSFRDEIDTGPALRRFKRVLLPGPDPELYAQQLVEAGATKLFVPGLAFDRHGRRLGRGKGYYDRCIAALVPRRPQTIGLCLKCQILTHVPVEPLDQLVDHVITV